jgi:FtsZ-binding cell division protein ZapB
MSKATVNHSHREGQPKVSIRWWILSAAVFVIAVWGGNWFLLASLEPTDRGTIGDMFGAANALFSGLAFVGLISTLFLQREELKLQRQELADTRQELRGQKEASEKQNVHIATQTFEGTLFQMLGSLDRVLDSIDMRDNRGNITSKGRDTIAAYYARSVRARQNLTKHPSSGKNRNISIEAFESTYSANGHELNHYFRLLYNIFKFIDNSTLTEKIVYSNTVRAQLSDHELLMLFYNSLAARGEKFKTYIEKYHLLKHVRNDLLLSPEDENLHSPQSYG